MISIIISYTIIALLSVCLGLHLGFKNGKKIGYSDGYRDGRISCARNKRVKETSSNNYKDKTIAKREEDILQWLD